MTEERIEKYCPFCAERILAAATKCRFCGSAITSAGQKEAERATLLARLRVSRESQFMAAVRAFRLIIDGNFVSYLSAGDTVELDMPPGDHDVIVEITTIGTMRGQTVITLTAGETRHLKASIKMGLWKNSLVLE